jgi:hypothetical protein
LNALVLSFLGPARHGRNIHLGGYLTTINEYRQHARDCLQIARNAQSSDERAILIEMAKTWHRLAQEKERNEPHRVAAE